MPAPAAARLRVCRSTPLLLVLALAVLLVILLVLALLPSPPAAAGVTGFGGRVVVEAARHRGKPYRYGAAGPNAFDCSGYTSYVFRTLGRRLPHTSRGQYAVVRHVTKGTKRPGDLIFSYDGGGRIYHVGIYAGAGTIWHAPRSGTTVRQSPLWSSRYWVGRVA